LGDNCDQHRRFIAGGLPNWAPAFAGEAEWEVIGAAGKAVAGPPWPFA